MDWKKDVKTNCISFIDPKTNEPVSDIPCKDYEFPNFNNLDFDAKKFDKAISETFGNEAPWFKNGLFSSSPGSSPFVFPENYVDRELTQDIHPQEQQKFVSKYINLHNNFSNGTLLYHSLGSGKSCSSIIVGEAFKAYDNGTRSVLVVLPNALMEQFKQEVLGNIKMTTGSKYVNSCISDIRIYDEKHPNGKRLKVTPDLHEYMDPPVHAELMANKDELTMEQQRIVLKLEQLQKVQEVNYITSLNRIFENMDWKLFTHDTFINRINPLKYKTAEAESDKIIGMMRNKKQLVIFDEIQNLVSHPDGPSGGKRYEILRNFLNTVNKSDNRYVFLTATPIRNKPSEIGLLLNLLNPRLQFPETDEEFSKLFVDKVTQTMKNRELFRWMTKGYVSYFRGGNPKFFPNKRIIKVYHPMCRDQKNAYDKSITNYKQKLIRSSIDIFYQPKDFMSKPREYSYSYMENFKLIHNTNIPDHLFNEVNKVLSPKISDIVKRSHNSTGKVFIYSEFIQYGIVPIVRMFEILGYEILYGLKQEKFNEIASIKKKRILIWTGSKGSGTHMLKHKPDTKRISKTLMNIFNSEKNNHGDLIKIVIGSDAIKEGISFKAIKDVHLCGPWWNNAKIEQIIARAVRFGSHNDVSDKTVNVYKHISIDVTDMKSYKSSPGKWLNSLSAEQYIESVAARKEQLIRRFELTMKESSVDCKLNKYGNLIRLTEMTDYYFMNYLSNNVRPKKTSANNDNIEFVKFMYFLDESTGKMYEYISEKPGPGSEINIDYSTDVMVYTLVPGNKKIKTLSSKFPGVTLEQLECDSEAKFKFEVENKEQVNALVGLTAKINMSQDIFRNLIEPGSGFLKKIGGIIEKNNNQGEPGIVLNGSFKRFMNKEEQFISTVDDILKIKFIYEFGKANGLKFLKAYTDITRKGKSGNTILTPEMEQFKLIKEYEDYLMQVPIEKLEKMKRVIKEELGHQNK
jgi:hypothetical protein